MKRLIGLLLAVLLVGVAFAQNQTVNTVPSSNTTFLTDLQNFLKQEDASRYAHHFYGMVVSGGTHATGAGLTWAPASLTAYVDAGNYVTETGSITYPNNDTGWVIASNAITGNLGTFTRVSGTHYLTDFTSGTKPTLPSGTLWLMEVVTAAGSVTTVTDLRTRVVYAGTYLEAALPAAGVRGRIAFVRDSGTGAMFFDNGTAWASVGISNPMTTAGDLIYGGVAGAPARLAPGTSSQVLVSGTTPAWTGTPTITTLTTTGQNAHSAGPYGAAAGNTGEYRFLELAANGTNYGGFKAPDALAANVVWVLPTADGTANQVLATDGSGTLSFAATTLPRSYLAGLTLSNDGTDATNDIDIAVGQAVDGGNATAMSLAAATVKKTDAVWVVGTNQGCLDTGTVANDTYHFFVIRRTDTGVVDVLCSLSASAPTMPTGYSQKRRIGSIVRAGGTIRAFVQMGDYFQWTATPVNSWTAANPGTAAVNRTLSVPTGLNVTAQVMVSLETATGDNSYGLLSDLNTTDVAPTVTNSNHGGTGAANAVAFSTELLVRTDTTAQIRSRISASDASVQYSGSTRGWFDRRGRDD